MSIIRWNPGRMMRPLDFESLFENFFDTARYPTKRDETWMPRVDVQERDDRFEVNVELPGMKKENIDIGIQENRLTIKGEKDTEEENKDKKYYIRERVCGRFERSFTLPDNVDKDKIEANFTDGVLKMEIPKIEIPEEQEVKIKVK